LLNNINLCTYLETYIVSLNPTHVIKFVSRDLQQVSGLLWFPPPIKLTS
jgi:hypothetical protein